jgi:hypothetical protein
MEQLISAFRFAVMVNERNHNFFLTNVSNGTLFGGIDEMTYAAAKAQFSDVAEVVIGKESNQNFINVNQEVVLRVKHFDRSFRTRNAKTRHNSRWEQQGQLFPLPPVERLDFGYRSDPLGIEIQDAFVALRVRSNLLWLWQVLGDEIQDPWAQYSLTPVVREQEPKYLYDNFGSVGPDSND